ncbi:proline-rich domain-containing protein [Amycolatopsis sp. H20-H5]|uniref:proline-rich domain-containing protein n=1 Tax=Amycolatopsis sp. H20-H5 TaxID=3046309 RepID=UPI002DBEAEA6|nr:proline-rich domain-containing protein [Amycolatopsis sp. H20-H5]MEC3978816.1 proline-rich domain-containing protein [Amycolatopsis sp. H20-H5]
MTDTGGTSGPEGADAPTPSQGIPQQSVPSPDAQQAPSAGQPAQTPQPGQWQSPTSPPPGAPQYQAPQPPYAQPPYGMPNPAGLGKPGVIALRPLNVGDILDGAITAIRRYPLLILGFAAVIAVITAGLNFVGSLLLRPGLASLQQLGPGATDRERTSQALDFLLESLASNGVILLVTMLGTTVLTGFLTVVMGKAVLGKPISFQTAWKEVTPRLLPLLGLTVLYTLAVVAAAIFCLLPAVIPYVFWALASPALLLERGGIRQSFSRSAKLVSGTFWRVFGILALAWLIGALLSLIISIPFGIGSGVFDSVINPTAIPAVPSIGALLLESAGSIITQTIITPFTALVTVLVYIDQRMRKEGMDIELARAAGVTPPPAPPQPQSW